MASILIIDDNEELLMAFKMFLAPHFREIRTIKNPNLILSEIEKYCYDVILLDMNFSAGVNTGNEGIFWMNQIKNFDPSTVIVLITAYGDIELAIKALKEGATDFIQKSWDEQKILATILSALKHHESALEIKTLKKKQKHLSENIERNYYFCKGKSDAMIRIAETIQKVAETDANILILGENGTGKEVIAREIHRQSLRRNEIFVGVDLGSLSESLFESELFGHKRGAFTDAKENREGRLEIATGGTLFLDEIGNLNYSLQSKLLSVLQNREIIPLGSNKKVPIDIRLICASNKPLLDMASEATFREDLLYRINTIQINLPPLRERSGDIPVMAEYFLDIYSGKYRKNNLSISNNAMEKLKKHDWPGNIREIQHAIEKAVILSETSILKPDNFLLDNGLTKKHKTPETLNIEKNEKLLVILALEKSKGNISIAAKELGINRSTLYDKIRKYEI